MTNVVYLPGLLGSDLGYRLSGPRPYQNVWCDLPSLLVGGAALLQLGPDGVSPGPLAEGRAIVPTSILGPVYAPLGLWMLGQGWRVLVCPYDWRQSVITSAASVWQSIRQAFPNQPIYIVAHSQGGLVARAVWKLMFEAGADSELKRIVSICTPHYGSMEPVRTFCRLPFLYEALVVATGLPPLIRGCPGPAYLDDVIASWPGFFELVAFLAEGPLPTLAPDLAPLVWQAAYYAGGNPYLLQQTFDTAAQSQEYLLDAIPPGRLTCVAGTGEYTCHLPSAAGGPLTDAGYLFTQEGDGLVTVDSALVPGSNSVTTPGSHAGLLLDPRFWQLLPPLLLG